MIDTCREGNYPPPKWELELGGLWVIFEFPKKHIHQLSDTAGGVSGSVNSMFDFIQANPGLSAKAISDKLNVPQRTVERWIKSLREHEQIEFRGAPKTGGYFIIIN